MKLKHEIVQKVKRARSPDSKKGNALDNSPADTHKGLTKSSPEEMAYPKDLSVRAGLQHRACFTTPAAQVHLSQMVSSDFSLKNYCQLTTITLKV